MQDMQQIEQAVCRAYSAAAERPRAKHAFPVGRQFAVDLGYPAQLLDSLPAIACEGFAGVAGVLMNAALANGAEVLDLGCGSGLDSLIAARRVGATGRVVGVDFSEAMLTRARRAALEADLGNVEFHLADARGLPFPNDSFDAVLINGLFNLNPARAEIFKDVARVVRGGGSVWAAELILTGPMPSPRTVDESTWFS